MCAIISLQQPNTRLLQEFDRIVILHAGTVVYNDHANNLYDYFTRLDYTLSTHGSIIDHVSALLATDPSAVVKATKYYHSTQSSQSSSNANRGDGNGAAATKSLVINQNKHSILSDVYTLIHRFLIIAIRTLPLYWLQLVLVGGFCFLIGVVWWQTPFVVGQRMTELSNGLTWLCFVAAYIQVFRVFYQAAMKNLYLHEYYNQSYNVISWNISEFLITSIGVFVAFVPGFVISLIMIGVPYNTIGVSILILWFTAMTSEVLLNVIVQLVKSVPYAVLICQGVLVLTSVFAGGAFISFDRVDQNFWVWMQDISLYNYATRAVEINTFNSIQYSCDSVVQSQCVFSIYSMPCATTTSATSCMVNGRDVLYAVTGLGNVHSEWFNYGILVVLMFGFRLILIVLQWIQPTTAVYAYYLKSYIKPNQHNQTAPINNNSSTSVTRSNDNIRIEIGKSVDDNNEVNKNRRVLQWSDVVLRLRSNKKELVSDMNGYAISGRILGILGGSGAGKTTFLNALSFRAPYAVISGDVKLNGRQLNRDDIFYVPQFDTLNPSITCKQTLRYISKLYNQDVNYETMNNKIAELMELLDMSDRVNDFVGTLTFSERKRLSVCMALFSEANIILMDEPTTGMSIYNHNSVVSIVIQDINIG